jgi:broad specificity phosphatase PhoE
MGAMHMKLILIRHGEPDYFVLEGKNFIGQGRELMPLSAQGTLQANTAAADDRLKGSELIVSSPYPRALQTAAVISRYTGLDICVEIDLHEWLPDKSFRNNTKEYLLDATMDFIQCKGAQSEQSKYNWESMDEVACRVFSALQKYLDHTKIIVVSHAVVMRQFVFAGDIPHCGILETEFDKDFVKKGFNEQAYKK